MLTSPNRSEKAVHSYHCRGDMVVRMRKVLVIPLTAELVRVLQCLIYRIPVFVSGTWILDSNRLWDPGFLELFSSLSVRPFRFQFSPFPQKRLILRLAVFRITKPRIPDSTSKIFPDSEIRIPLHVATGPISNKRHQISN